MHRFNCSFLPLNRYSETFRNLFPKSGLAFPVSPGRIPFAAPIAEPLPIAPGYEGPATLTPFLWPSSPSRPGALFLFSPHALPAGRVIPRGPTALPVDLKSENGAIYLHGLFSFMALSSASILLSRSSCSLDFRTRPKMSLATPRRRKWFFVFRRPTMGTVFRIIFQGSSHFSFKNRGKVDRAGKLQK